MPGIVYLVGAGPGDPELLTVKAHRLLGEADTIVHDHLVGPGILELAKPGAEKIFVGKKAGRVCRPQSQIDRLLIELARTGKTVVRLKGGDPFIFGRGGEEAEALAAAGIPFEIVPGVTAALAAAAYTGIPLTHREHSSAVVFLTGHEDPSHTRTRVRWEDYARLGATLCIYMGVRSLQGIAQRLQAGGLAPSTPAAIVQSATTGAQRHAVGTLATLPTLAEEGGFETPALVIIGDVARFAGSLAWFDPSQLPAESLFRFEP